MSALVSVTGFMVSRLPNTTPDQETWGIRVEGAGGGKWAVRHMSQCLDKSGTWGYEPPPSSRDAEWLERNRWSSVGAAIAAAIAVEPHIRVNGMTPADVVALRAERGQP